VYCKRFVIPVAGPFRLDLTVWALRRRQNNTVDQWANDRYTRVIVCSNDVVKVTIIQQTSGAEPGLVVTLQSNQALTERIQMEAELLIRKMLGLTVDLRRFYSLAGNYDVLKPLVEQFSGVRPPRFPSIFEGLVNSIACQQVSLDSGIATLNRLSQTFGVSFVNNGVTSCAFPRPVDLLDIPEGAIRKLGFSRQKERAIKELSTNVATSQINLSNLEGLTNGEVVEYLSKMRGIGRWSSEYVLLRGLGRLDTFPGDDVGAQNNLQRLFHLDAKPDYDEIRKLMSRWNPYQGLIYFHLLLEKLRIKGFL